MKFLGEVKVGSVSGLNYREWTVVGTVAKIISELEYGEPILISKIIDLSDREVSMSNIRAAIATIRRDRGISIFTRKKGEYLMIGLL